MSTLMDSAPEEEVTARTHVESSRSLLNWDIQNFDALVPNEFETGLFKSEKDEIFSLFKALRSPIFRTRLGKIETKQSEQKWFVQLDINPKSEAEKYVSLNLYYQPLDSCLIEPSRLVVSFYILGSGNIVLLKHSFGTAFANLKSGVHGWGYPKFVSLKTLWENKNSHLVNNILRVRVEVVVFRSALTEITESGFFERGSSSSGANKLVDSMTQLLKSGKDADITINCGGQVFLVHSAILKGRSYVFERMLESGMKESGDKIIKIVDVDPTIFEAFLEYIYTFQVELNLESMDKAFGLVGVADKYGIEELKTICFKFMFEHMSLQNAGEIAVFSYQHNAGESLRSRVVNFCQTNWSELAKLSTFEECVKENPRAFFNDKQDGK